MTRGVVILRAAFSIMEAGLSMSLKSCNFARLCLLQTKGPA